MACMKHVVAKYIVCRTHVAEIYILCKYVGVCGCVLAIYTLCNCVCDTYVVTYVCGRVVAIYILCNCVTPM